APILRGQCAHCGSAGGAAGDLRSAATGIGVPVAARKWQQGKRKPERRSAAEAAREDIMQFTKFGLLAGLALGALVAATSAQGQEEVTVTVWSIDGANQVGPSDTFSAEFDAMDNGINVEYRILQFDEIVNETLRAYATG